MNELDLFIAANAISDAAERAAYLDQVCADQPQLRQRLDALLAGNAQSRHPLDEPPSHPQAPADNPLTVGGPARTGSFQAALLPEETVGTVIAGRYKLRQMIGEGGMGTVWMADQTEPVKRKVAVKLIRVDRGQSKTILARFEAERQAIALMDHPHIARLLDAGTTDNGSPFFVMELVKGIPLNEFCDQHRLTFHDRLSLFTQICSAVQHAHQKGIIHRDLKPSNILVESHDGKPVPKVIDFGLAKATTGLQLTDQSLFTAFGNVMGTPLYMAPEQASFNALDVDTRADVYALGVILYELLTGTTPITRDTLKKAALDELLKLIREQEAPTPSSRLSTAESAPSVAASRQIEPAKLGRFVKGELDWIVLKALSKDRNRRYESANGFARDIERFLAHEPVQAGPPSTSYRVKKFVQRNRGQVIAASLVLLALVAGAVGTTLGLIEARRQAAFAVAAQQAEAERADGERLAKLDAEAKKAEAEQAQTRAEAGEKLAEDRLVEVETEKQIAKTVKNFLQTKLLAQADTTAQADALLKAGGMAGEAKFNPTIRELLDRAALELAPEKIEANFPNQPLVQAEILRTVGIAYLGVGEAATALPFLTRSVELFSLHLGPDHPDTLMSMNNLAIGYSAVGKLDKALSLMEETLKLQQAKLGPDHPNTLKSMGNLGIYYLEAGQLDKALPLLEETLKLSKAKLGPDHPDTLRSMNNLAWGFLSAGQFDKALPLLEETLKLQQAKLGPDHPSTIESMNNLAGGYRAVGQLRKALPLWEETLKLFEAKHGPDHPDNLKIMGNLGLYYLEAGQLDKALPLSEETLMLMKDKLGPDHPQTLTQMGWLAMVYKDAGQLDRALPLYEETLKLQQAKLGPDHPDTLGSMNNLAIGYHDVGKLDKALSLMEETLKLTQAKLGHDHPNTLKSMGNLGLDYKEAGKLDRALPLFEETLKLSKAKLGPDHPLTLVSAKNLAQAISSKGDFYRDSGKVDEAIAAYREAASVDPDHRIGLYGLAHLYRDRGRLDEAIEEFAKQVELEPKDAVMRQKLADCLRYRGRFSEAVAEYRKVIELDPSNGTARSNAGFALMGASDLDGAIEITPPNTRHYQRLTALAAMRPKLDELASGTTVVSTFEEARKLTELAVTDKRYALGAKAYHVALEANGADRHLFKTHYGCYHAQCAVLAGTGADPTYPSAEKQATMRLLGLQWLTNERDAWKADLAKNPKERSNARRALQYWLYDPRLTAVREEEALGALPEAERTLWLAFWEDVRQTLKNSE